MKGYFHKRGSKWAFTIDVGKDPETGKRKQKAVSGFKTKKEAEKACAKLIMEIENGEYIEESKATFSEFITDWLQLVAKPTLRPTTYAGYESAVHSRLLPTFGHRKLLDIKPVHVMRFYSSLLDEGITEEFIQYLNSILKNSFRTAVKWELLKQNIMDKVEPPSRKRKQLRVWTLEEAISFLEAAKETRPHFYMTYLLAIFTGMRRGEILALRWKDCMLDEGKISVNKSLSFVKGQGIVCQETKTGSSNRVISISDMVVEELRKHRLQQQKMKLMLGEAYQDTDYVIAKETGKPVNPNYIFNHFKKLLGKVDVPPIRFHDLRHTHATIMLKLGEHPKVVSERLGHSSIQMTMNVYSHVTIDMQKESSDRFEQAFQAAKKKPM